jgi:predicted DsbA family dithiol-disulfide isomerase
LKALQETEQDVEVVWRSYELRPAGSPPISPDYLQHIETNARPRFNKMMLDEHGVVIQAGPFGIDSRLALIADKYAESQGNFAFHDAATRAYWVDAQDISQVSVLRAVAESVGLDGEAFEKAITDPASRAVYDAEVARDVRQAREFGLQGVPAIVFNQKYLIPGAVPVDTLRQVLAQVRAEG